MISCHWHLWLLSIICRYVCGCINCTGMADGLCYRLTKPCPKAQPTRYELAYSMKDQYEVSRNSLEKRELLGSGNFGEVWRGVSLLSVSFLGVDILRELSETVSAPERYHFEVRKSSSQVRSPRVQDAVKGCLHDPVV